MPKPIANAKPFTGELIGEYLLTLQKGTATDAAGLDQMTKLKLNVLRDYILQGVAPALHPVSQSGSTLPENPANGDYFFADTTFTVSGKTYTQGHMYTWDGTEWKDTSDIFSQYATQAQVDDLQLKVDALDGLNFKGSITEAELEQITPSADNKGWMYYVSDLGAYKASDGTAWVTVIDYVTQTVESGNTTQAPSSNAVYQMKTELESKIRANSQRIENLEVAVSGSLVQTNTDATMANTKTITNANEILPWAILKRVGARAVSWNQLCPNGNFANTDYWTSRDDDPISISNNVLTVTASSGSLKGLAMNENPIKAVAGHKYLLMGYVNSSVAGTASIAFANYYGSHTISANQWTFVARVFEQSNSEDTQIYFLVMGSFSGGETLQYKNVMAFDLTAMGMDTLTADQFRAKFPASYYPYNAGQIINLNPSGFGVVGWNKWDEEWELGAYDSYGQKAPNSSLIRNKNMIPVEPSTIYYFHEGYAPYHNVFYYDAGGNYISKDTSDVTTFTTPSNCYYLNFTLASGYGTTYRNDVCINLSQSDTTKPLHNGVYQAYQKTTIDTSFTEDYLYVNENCHDYSENVLVDGQKMREEHRIVGSYTFTGQEAWENRGTNQAGAVVYSVDCRTFMPYEHIENVPCIFSKGEYIRTVAGVTYVLNSSITRGFYLYYVGSAVSDKYIYMVGLTPSDIQGMKVNYQLADPTTSLHNDPIPNFPSEDGTTITAITPQTDLVNAIDVPTTIAYMTKIGA